MLAPWTLLFGSNSEEQIAHIVAYQLWGIDHHRPYKVSAIFQRFFLTMALHLFSSSSKFYFQQNITMEQYKEKENTL